MTSGFSSPIGDDVLVEDPEGLESETERLYIGFGGVGLNVETPIPRPLGEMTFLDSLSTWRRNGRISNIRE